MATGITIHLYSTLPLSTTLINLYPLKSLLVWHLRLTSLNFNDPVYFADKDETIGSESTEIKGRFVGISEHVGHLMPRRALQMTP